MEKEKFIKYIRLIEGQMKKDEQNAKHFRSMLALDFPQPYDSDYLYTCVFEILRESMKDKSNWIGYFANDLKFGKAYKDGMVKVKNKTFRLKTPSDLFDIIQQTNEENESKKH